MEVRGRMELRQGDAWAILSAAFKVCLSLKSIFLLILLLTVAYESAIERYAVFTLTTSDGKTTFNFGIDPQQQQQQQNQSQIQPPAQQDSFLSKLLRFSISIPDPGSPRLPENQSPPPENQSTPPENHQSTSGTHQETHSTPDAGNSGHADDDSEVSENKTGETSPEDDDHLHADVEFNPEAQQVLGGESLREDDRSKGETPRKDGEKLPALRIKYVGNGTKAPEPGAPDEFNLGFFSSRFRGRRGALDRGTTEPSIALGVLLLAFVVLLLVLALVFFILCFNQAVVPAVLGFSSISVLMGKPVSLRRALTSGIRVGISRLMWLSVLYSLLMGAHSFFLSRILFRSSDDVDDLLYRISSMPFAIVSIFRDEKIAELGIRSEAGMFLVGEFIFNSVSYAVFIVACWVTIVERGYRGIRAFRRSWELLRVLPWTAICFRVCEGFLAGRSSKFLVGKALGAHASMLFVGAVDLYMVVVWLVFYMAARSKVEPGFGHRDLDEFLHRVR